MPLPGAAAPAPRASRRSSSRALGAPSSQALDPHRVSGSFTVNPSQCLRVRFSGEPQPVHPLEWLGSTGHRLAPLCLLSAQAPPHPGTSACIRLPVFPRQPVHQTAGLWPVSCSNPLQLSMAAAARSPGAARWPEGWGSRVQPHEGVGAPGPRPPGQTPS